MEESFENPGFDEKPPKKTDEELISDWEREGMSQQSSSARFAIEFFEENHKLIEKFIKNPNLYDIGGGRHGLGVGLDIVGSASGIKHVTLVEPFATEHDIYESQDKEKIKDKFDWVAKDGLSFLLEKNTAPASVLVCSLDKDVVGSFQYLQRLAEEIYRIVPEDGVFICVNSDEVQREAAKLFPFQQKFGAVWVFSKKDILSSVRENMNMEVNAIAADVEGILRGEKYLAVERECGTDEVELAMTDFWLLSDLRTRLHELVMRLSGQDRGDWEENERNLGSYVDDVRTVLHWRDENGNFSQVTDEHIRGIWQRAKKLIDDNF